MRHTTAVLILLALAACGSPTYPEPDTPTDIGEGPLSTRPATWGDTVVTLEGDAIVCRPLPPEPGKDYQVCDPTAW